jgi:hypothetical protein
VIERDLLWEAACAGVKRANVFEDELVFMDMEVPGEQILINAVIYYVFIRTVTMSI